MALVGFKEDEKEIYDVYDAKQEDIFVCCPWQRRKE